MKKTIGLSIDFHTHILPDIDDGSPDCDTSIKMLKLCWEQKISHVVLTPHFYIHKMSPASFLKKRQRAYSELKKSIIKESSRSEMNLPQMILGAEVYLLPQIVAMDDLDQLCIGSSRYIMIELPEEPWTEGYYRMLEQLIFERHLIPIFAHIEHYLFKMKKRDVVQLEELAFMGSLFQVNANFVVSNRKRAIKAMNNGYIHIIGSDCHDIGERLRCIRPAYQVIEQFSDEGLKHKLERIQKKFLSEIEIV